ncbi:amidohydrolase family protein [Mycobacteroides abscessus]
MVDTSWVDVHAHFSPPVSAAALEQRWIVGRKHHFLSPGPHQWTPEETLEVMDRAGVGMQMLSNMPNIVDVMLAADPVAAIRASNDYGASVVSDHPTRFGLLAALATDNVEAALAEIERTTRDLQPDGFAITLDYNGVYLSDERLAPMWQELDRLSATVFTHPDAFKPGVQGRPVPLIEVGFETTRAVVDLIYTGWFNRYPNVKLIIPHCGGGGALPAMSGRLGLLGAEPWVPNPHKITSEQIREYLSRLYLDTAATGFASSLAAALEMVAPDHLVYGSDCGVGCSNERTMEISKNNLLKYAGLTAQQRQGIAQNALQLFPRARSRREKG